jgi:hypothetical protein
MLKLIETYDRIKNIFEGEIEPFASVQLIEEYRRYLKPETVRVVLLAESHVFTSDEDRLIKIPTIENLRGYPEEYAKFVYCLGYGEKALTKDSNYPKGGTPQYWKILFSCDKKSIISNEDFIPILGKTSYEKRLENKIKLLKDLKKKGVWLVDASIVSVYNHGRKPPRSLINEIIKKSWESYTRDVVISSNPAHIICIGKGVANTVENDLKKYFPNNHTIIPQPNAHLTAKEHLANYNRYSKICSGLTG